MKPKLVYDRPITKRTLPHRTLLQKPALVKKRILKMGRSLKALKRNENHWSAKKKKNKSSSSSEIYEPRQQTRFPSHTISESSDEGSEESDENLRPSTLPALTPSSAVSAMDESFYRQTAVRELSSSEPGENMLSTEESNSDSGSEEIQEIRNFWLFESDQSDLAVLVLRHPCQVVLSGCLQLRSLSGSVDVHGWHLTPDTLKFTPVYSTLHYGRYILCTVEPERLPKWVNWYKHVNARLASVSAEMFLSSVFSVATSDCVVIAVSRLEPSWSVQYAVSMLTPSLFFPQRGPFLSKRLDFSICQNLHGALLVTPEHRKIAEQIVQAIQYARSVGSPAPRIVVCGDRNTGKSTFTRFLINSVLSVGVCPSICHLDGDPGQSEFTPSCCVTLTSVDSPLLGPPFTHLKTPIRQCFVGGPSVEDTPDIYSESFGSLIAHYNENFPSVPLFVNTMGWCRGLGLSLLVDVLRLSGPSLVIQMGGTLSVLPVINDTFLVEECGWMTTRNQVKPGQLDTEFRRVVAVKDVEPSSPREVTQLGLGAPLQRLLSALTYLGRVLANSTERLLTRIQPKCVPVEEVGVMLPSKVNVKPENLLHVINGSWVALCSVPPEKLSDVKSQSSTKALKLQTSVCIGFGLVRGIDLDQGFILVLTPEPLKRLQVVNAFSVTGDLMPARLYTEQETEGPVPYISETLVSNKTGLGVKVKQTKKDL